MSELTSGKILCITNDFGPRAGGIETFVMGLIERAPKGSIIVYTSGQGDTTSYDQGWLRDFGVEVIRDSSKILLPSPWVVRRVKKVIARDSIKQVFFGAAAPLGVMARSLRKKGVVNIVALTHGHEVWWAKVFPFNLAMRRIGSTVDSLTYLGEFTQKAISQALSKKAAEQMMKIAPGIDVEHFSPQDSLALRRELGIDNKKVIVSVGRLVHRKGQDHLIESMPEILKKVPDAHLLMVGQGPYLEHLAKLVAIQKVENHVSFIGRIQYAELPRFICAGDVFAMPSRSRLAGLEVEGLGIVYLEASACGLPVVAGDSGGAPDAVVQGVTGLVVDGTNNAQIASSIISLLNDPQKSQAMGAAGRQWIIDNWRWEIWSTRFNLLLEQ
jgi:phosphatidylinositol alpha-1,6-mannosyltransferase